MNEATNMPAPSRELIPLRYHTRDSIFFEADGSLVEEPEEALEELETDYKNACEEYTKWRKEYEKVMQPYRNPETGQIDYDALEKDNSPEGLRAFQFSLADFNSFGALDEYEYLIDLKITHMNAKLSQQHG